MLSCLPGSAGQKKSPDSTFSSCHSLREEPSQRAGKKTNSWPLTLLARVQVRNARDKLLRQLHFQHASRENGGEMLGDAPGVLWSGQGPRWADHLISVGFSVILNEPVCVCVRDKQTRVSLQCLCSRQLWSCYQDFFFLYKLINSTFLTVTVYKKPQCFRHSFSVTEHWAVRPGSKATGALSLPGCHNRPIRKGSYLGGHRRWSDGPSSAYYDCFHIGNNVSEGAWQI